MSVALNMDYPITGSPLLIPFSGLFILEVDTADLPTPLQKTPCIHHVSSMEHASFNPAHNTPHSTATITNCGSLQTPPRPVCCCLSFTSNSSEGDQDPDSTPEHSDEEEDFQTVPLDDEH